MKLIVGLGNTGDRYKNTRHNLGFEALDHLKHTLGIDDSWEFNKKFKAEIIPFPTLDLILAKPTTFMNNSGLSVSAIANFYKIKPEDIIVIQDELDVLLGKIKIRFGGGFGGHHGVESVMESVGTDKFIRVRLGIGTTAGFLGEHQRKSFNAEHFVMEEFAPTEHSKVKAMIKKSSEAIKLLLEKGLEPAQNQFH